jgi:hypothetical protein
MIENNNSFSLLYYANPRIKVNIPDGIGKEYTEYNINWANNIEGHFYECGVTQCKDSGSTIWLMHIANGVITPISCTCYLSEKEYSAIKLCERLCLSKDKVMNNILLKRIEEYECLKNTKTITT